jgi:phosphoglycerate dehydrogenase-like enzyme
LDAFAAAQLPDDSVLWSMSNVLISPRSAADTDRQNARVLELFVANLRRYLRGEEVVGRLWPAAA